MDEMVIKTDFTKSIIEHYIEKAIRKKLDKEIDVKFVGPINVDFDDNELTVHIDVEATIGKKDLWEMIKDL